MDEKLHLQFRALEVKWAHFFDGASYTNFLSWGWENKDGKSFLVYSLSDLEKLPEEIRSEVRQIFTSIND